MITQRWNSDLVQPIFLGYFSASHYSDTILSMMTSQITGVSIVKPYPEPVYTGLSSVHWNATGWPSVHWDTTGPPREYLQGTLEHHWKNLVETDPHWNATGETLTFAAYTGTPLEGLWQSPHNPTHIVKHAEQYPCQFEMTRWRDTSKQVDRSLYIQPLLVVHCSAMDASSALNTCEYFNITLRMPLICTPL